MQLLILRQRQQPQLPRQKQRIGRSNIAPPPRIPIQLQHAQQGSQVAPLGLNRVLLLLILKVHPRQYLYHHDGLGCAVLYREQLVPDLLQHLEKAVPLFLEEIYQYGLIDKGLQEHLLTSIHREDILQETLHAYHPFIDYVYVRHLIEGLEDGEGVSHVGPRGVIEIVHGVAGEVGLELVDDAWHDDLLDLGGLEGISLGELGHVDNGGIYFVLVGCIAGGLGALTHLAKLL